MKIDYSNAKEVKCYRDFVLNPEDRRCARAFSKTFGNNLMEPAKKLHDRLNQYPDAGAYNAMFGQSDNRIELKQSTAGKAPLVLKVRIGRGPRKFFNQIIDSEGTLLLTKDWTGDFQSVRHIYIIAINNHDYKSV